MTYAEAIYKLRRKLLLTQEELAEELQVSFTSVFNIINMFMKR